MGTIGNVKVDPMAVYFGEDTYQVSSVTLRADVGGDLNNDYFLVYTPAGLKYHIWYNINSAGVDPAPGGSTAVPVAGATGASAATLATATASAIDGLAGFTATALGSIVTITCVDYGYAQGPHEGVGTNFTFTLDVQGDTAAEVGYVQGDIEWAVAEDLVDVTAHQTGTNVLSQIRTGKQVEVTLNLEETSASQIRKIFIQGGAAFTPAGGSATEVYGYGFNKDFTQTLVQAKKLKLHPKVLSVSDQSRDITFWKAYPRLESLTFSGENILTLPVTFKVYPDTTKSEEVQYFAIGNGSQTLT